jgi:hypothetical protein
MFNNKVFNDCEFIIGHDNSLVVIVPQNVPKDDALTMRIVDNVVSFYKSDEVLFGRVICVCPKTLRCLRKKTRIGLIEAINGRPQFPVYIAATARVEASHIDVERAAA